MTSRPDAPTDPRKSQASHVQLARLNGRARRFSRFASATVASRTRSALGSSMRETTSNISR